MTHLRGNRLINDTNEKSDLICLSSQSHDGGMCDHRGQLGTQSLKILRGTAVDVWRQALCEKVLTRSISRFNLSSGRRRDIVEESSSMPKKVMCCEGEMALCQLGLNPR